MRRSWLLPPASSVLLQTPRLAPLHDPTATQLQAPIQAPIHAQLQAHRQWRCMWQRHSMGVITFVLFIGFMIVPVLAEVDFASDNKAVNMQRMSQIKYEHGGGQDGTRNNVEGESPVVLHPRLQIKPNVIDRGDHKYIDHQQENEALKLGQDPPVAHLLQDQQRLAEWQRRDEQKQRDAQHEQERLQKQRDAQHEQERQQKLRDAQHEQERQQKLRDAQHEQERQQKLRDTQPQQQRQQKQLHEFMNAVEVVTDKKLEESAKSQQKQEVVIGDNMNTKSNNIQEIGEGKKIDYSAGNKGDNIVKGAGVDNQQSQIIGHDLPVENKDNDQIGNTLSQEVKPGYDGNKDKLVKRVESGWEFGRNVAPRVIGNYSRSQLVDSTIKSNLDPPQDFRHVHNANSNTNIGHNDDNNQERDGPAGITNIKTEVDSADLQAKKGKVDIDSEQQQHVPVKEVDSQQQQQHVPVKEVDSQQQQQHVPVKEVDSQQQQQHVPVKEVDSQQQQQHVPVKEVDSQQQQQHWPVKEVDSQQQQQHDGVNNNDQQQQHLVAVNEVNNQQQQLQQQNPQQQPADTGGIDIRWDWEDFSIMLNSYGAAEMKVRRAPHATTGEPWPMPQYYSKKDNKIFRLDKDFSFVPVGVKCDILEEGVIRHLQRTLRGSVEDMYDNLQHADGTPIEDPTLRYGREEFLKAPVISRVEVKVKKPCSKYPTLESDESYDLVVKRKKVYIWANEVWGALRGLETFGHLVWRGTDDSLYIKETVISDYPRFPHRGLLIDTSRHFLFKEVILDIIESMEMNKLNVFHWHIVDDQSFPYESKVYPELSRKGAFHPTYVYSLEDIAEIIEYARLRGVRVMPEFDTPGHTYAWGFSRPELLTQCYTGNMAVKGYFGPIDPSKNSTYRFLQTLFQEIVEVFKDQYLHLGGDEVPLGCWQSNPEVLAFARELAKLPRSPQQTGQFPGNGGFSMWSDEIRGVYEYYENRLISIVSEAGQKKKKAVKYVMWQEVMNNNLQLPNDTIIQVWMGDMGDVYRATSMGYQVLYSTCWYMDHIEYGTKWIKYYNCDPVDQSFGYHIDEKKVLGGEAAFWAEYFTNENLLPLMWPRASAAAERLWSSKDVKNIDKAAARLTEHRCRMIKRGINVGEINGPGYCLHAPPKRNLLNETVACKGNNCTHIIKENIKVFVSQRGSLLAECGKVLTTVDGNLFIVLILICIGVIALYALSKSPNRLQRLRSCKNRNILIVFILVLLVYFLCSTTIWMHAFDFTSSYSKTQHEDNTSGADTNNGDHPENIKTASS